jgi:hypothetical protein
MVVPVKTGRLGGKDNDTGWPVAYIIDWTQKPRQYGIVRGRSIHHGVGTMTAAIDSMVIDVPV